MEISDQPQFQSAQALELAEAFQKVEAEYLLLGKGALILLGFPGTTQDVDIFPEKSPENAERIIAALLSLGFNLTDQDTADIRSQKDFVQLKTGPFELDIVYAPDGIESYAKAKERYIKHGIFPIANIEDILASKKAANRPKDRRDIPMIQDFLVAWRQKHPKTLKTAYELRTEQEN